MNCILCQIINGDVPYSGIIKRTRHWTIMLSREQHTLGTIVIIHNTHTVNFSSISKDALLELQEVQLQVEAALTKLFKPDLFNYLQCGNEVEHLHLHLIPRYKTHRIYSNLQFNDVNFGGTVKETTDIESDEFITALTNSIKLALR